MINKRLKQFLHIAFWAYMFLSPMQFMRGTGLPMTQYWMNCMAQLLMMVMFYLNYLRLAPHYFVSGKHRYFLMLNTVIIGCFVIFLHYWSDLTHSIFVRSASMARHPDVLDELFYYVRDFVNLAVFATAGTCIALASRWFWSEDARKLAETARVKAEAAQAKAELSNLRSQINPHFLLNTLNNIYALTAIDSQRAQEAIQQLSHLLRHALYDYQQPSVPLAEEVEFLENYVKLMKIRLSPNVDVQFETHYLKSDTAAFEDVSLGKNIQIAPLIFISLVENAFKHGVSPTEPSFIHITILADNQQICCDIENSNHPKTSEDNSGHGIGLSQVQRRLDLAYPERYTWTKGVSENGQTYRSVITIVSSTAN